MVKGYRCTSVNSQFEMFEVKVFWTAICMQFKDQIMLHKFQSFSISSWKGGGGLFQIKLGIIALLLPIAVYS